MLAADSFSWAVDRMYTFSPGRLHLSRTFFYSWWTTCLQSGHQRNQQSANAPVRHSESLRGSRELTGCGQHPANVKFSSKAGIEAGIGDTDNYAGHLVPFNAGVVYEDNPTISYTPVAGAEYAHQVFSPVSISTLAQFSGTMTDPSYVYTGLLSSINGLQNPNFQSSTSDLDQQFNRLVTILTKLTETHRLHWLENPRQPGSFSIVIDRYAPDYSAEVRELLSLSGLPVPAGSPARMILPVSLALDGRETDSLGITTRSVADLIEILSAAVDIPKEELQSGVAKTYPPPGHAGRDLRIHNSETKPNNGAVAVQYRGTWFYIDETDLATKRFFRMLSALWSVKIAESASKGAAAPVLTVPVSR